MIQGCIDAPDGAIDLSRGPLVIRGWALGGQSPVSRVELRLGDWPLGRAGLGRPRADVAAALNDDTAELAGFELRVDPRQLDLDQVGTRNALQASVILLDGTRGELAPRQISIVPSDTCRAIAAENASKRRRRRAGKPIRLLCIARSLDFGGSQLRMRELVHHLRSTGEFDVTVLTPGDGPLRRGIEAAGASVHVAAMPIDDLCAYENGLAKLTRWAKGRFDLVMAYTLTSFPGIDLAERLRLPSIWRIGELEPVHTVVDWLGGTLDPLVELCARRAYKAASVVVLNSESVVRRQVPIGGTGCHAALTNGADVADAAFYLSTNDRQACRERLGISADRRVLVCAGTVWWIKGQALLVSALKQLAADYPHVECILVGQQHAPYTVPLSRIIADSGLGGSVRLLSYQDDLRPWWCAGDAAVCPSESEIVPTSILEAMAFGLPVLASRVGGIPEIVEDGVTGWLFEPSDLGSLVAGLKRMAAANPSELRGLGERAAERIRTGHDRAAALCAMTELLKHVCEGSRPPWLAAQIARRRASEPKPSNAELRAELGRVIVARDRLAAELHRVTAGLQADLRRASANGEKLQAELRRGKRNRERLDADLERMAESRERVEAELCRMTAERDQLLAEERTRQARKTKRFAAWARFGRRLGILRGV